ncbi:MAG: hypothetical protein LBC68_11745 [Prevotellaceae bacterium]|jgi:hypothetical protein|nr:hypothetical protein [Prevotellaceae bacterium]
MKFTYDFWTKNHINKPDEGKLNYNMVNNNCADQTVKAMQAAGINTNINSYKQELVIRTLDTNGVIVERNIILTFPDKLIDELLKPPNNSN